jgi:hypothetical protein
MWYDEEEVQGTWEYTCDKAEEVKSETCHSTYNSMASDNHTKNGNTIMIFLKSSFSGSIKENVNRTMNRISYFLSIKNI